MIFYFLFLLSFLWKIKGIYFHLFVKIITSQQNKFGNIKIITEYLQHHFHSGGFKIL